MCIREQDRLIANPQLRVFFYAPYCLHTVQPLRHVWSSERCYTDSLCNGNTAQSPNMAAPPLGEQIFERVCAEFVQNSLLVHCGFLPSFL